MNKTATISVLAAGTTWGLISIFVRGLSACGIDSMQISLIRMFYAALIFSAFTFLKDKRLFKINIKDIWYFIGTGIISVVLFNSFYFYSMIKGQASVSVVLLYTSPIFVMIFSKFIFKEKITKNKLIGLTSCILGCILVSGINGKFNVPVISIVTGILSGLFYGLFSIFGKIALKKYSTITVTTYTFIFGLLGAIPLGNPLKTIEMSINNYKIILLGIGISVICTALPYFLYTWGLERIESGKASIIVSVEVLVGCFIGIIFYNEDYNILKLIGISLIFISVLILNINKKTESVST